LVNEPINASLLSDYYTRELGGEEYATARSEAFRRWPIASKCHTGDTAQRRGMPMVCSTVLEALAVDSVRVPVDPASAMTWSSPFAEQ
jgi:hypothetical protein